ncbi:Os01g0608800 [Oryza sativa Japonica Group]|uniref:Os01g0608800 protein n=1 Tax=Oryza sativa subsp. japonica TaxID=39947 RepID=A0A0N7KDA8_ORYSJ|nr:Os01g0608800 [Oryza sativa Japonica Group]
MAHTSVSVVSSPPWYTSTGMLLSALFLMPLPHATPPSAPPAPPAPPAAAAPRPPHGSAHRASELCPMANWRV